MNTSSKKSQKKRFVTVAIIILLLAGYSIFVVTRFSVHTTYKPFSGQVFHIKNEGDLTIRLQNGTTGQIIECQNSESIQEIVEYLNSFRYRFWIPDLPIARGGWSYRVILSINDESVSYYFTNTAFKVRGIWFFGPNDYFYKLRNEFV